MDKYEELERMLDELYAAVGMPEEARTCWELALEINKFLKSLNGYVDVCAEKNNMKRIAGLTAYIGMMRQGLEQFIEIQKKIFENGDLKNGTV